MTEKKWWQKLLSLDGFLFIVFFTLDALSRIFDEAVAGFFTQIFPNVNVTLILVCSFGGIWLLRKFLQFILSKERRKKMFEKILWFFKKLFGKKLKKYKELLKDQVAIGKVEALCEQLLVEKQKELELEKYMLVAKLMCADRHNKEVIGIAQQLQAQDVAQGNVTG